MVVGIVCYVFGDLRVLVMIVYCSSLLECGIGCIFTLDNSVASVFIFTFWLFVSDWLG